MTSWIENTRSLPARDFWKALGVGLVNGVLLSTIMVPAFKSGLAPMPEQPSLAFAETIMGHTLPLPVGLLFHLVYVMFWSVAFVALFRPRLTFLNALWLALALWLVAMIVFFPIVGWGLFGLAISPKLIVAALVPHLLFAVFLWVGCRLAFGPARDPAPEQLR